MQNTVTPILAFNDNYIWAISQRGSPYVVVVDPGDAQPVISYLKQNNLSLDAILLTHHHEDHIGGVEELLAFAPVPIYGPKSDMIPMVTKIVTDGTLIEIPEIGLSLRVMTIPAHTLDHVAYYNSELLFCGDTLFTGGCGRVFEGTPELMLTALEKMAALGPQIKVYCGHEYTVNNLRFAKHVEPDNEAIDARLNTAMQLQAQGLPTVPSSMDEEFATNPFLRLLVPEVIAAINSHIGKDLDSSNELFAALREWKNSF